MLSCVMQNDFLFKVKLTLKTYINMFSQQIPPEYIWLFKLLLYIAVHKI